MVSAFLTPSVSEAGVYLTFRRGPAGDRLYAALEADRAAVERDLGLSVNWVSDGRKLWIMAARSFPEPLLGGDTEELRKVLCDWTARYISVFRRRLSPAAAGLTAGARAPPRAG